ncbi:ferrochelatase [Candidatus Synechococcus calcipolaris G9]|uniref:Ferrochelatase n=1 Tax=Candidatus Synechococcus calcipolaris G9 TaxID=1497997 RepID=A0ABT6EVE7_9SYNE|nr:ferrochelatase [Candidatus Synechococcus calcipolaris]MDG2989760.1 ferrochelatase [Candidatus Synechococcus calcipolaris G9]
MGSTGVLLLNLGGPDGPEDVRPFLYNLFSDPEIIRLPFPWLQKPLAWFISTSRARKSQKNYEEIGGGSPLRRITEEQAAALKTCLQSRGVDAELYVGMRYWHPFTEEAIAQIKADGIGELVVLPLYPQFSISTSGSSFRLLEALWEKDAQLQAIRYSLVPSWYDAPRYVESMVELIRQELAHCPAETTIFFSAHGVPRSYVTDAGDPYQDEIEACVALIMAALGPDHPHVLAYQSRVGPVEWLQPYTEDVIIELGAAGAKHLVVVPISFISEHIETLQEIDIEYRELAEESGIETFRRVPALNTYPGFIAALADLVTDALAAPPCTFSEVNTSRKRVKLYPQERWEWGMTTAAERWNGRLAMLGFLALLLELISGQGPLHMLGWL